MTKWILALIFVPVLAVGTASAQTAAKTGAPNPGWKSATPQAKPAATQTPTAKPAAPTDKPPTPTAKPATPAAPAPSAAAHGPGVYAHFVTNHGNFIIRLFDKDAPRTVENFVGLAEGKKQWKNPKTSAMIRRPYYNGLTFHRIISNFMIQGGDPLGTGTGGPGYEFADEFNPKLRHNKPGIVSMANAGPNTNGSQFFITVAPFPSGDGHYSIFGEVIDGMDVVMAISKVPTSGPPNNRPLKPVVMKSVRIERVS
jgi:peptidyl-prolyl cis-trans isomerase A (cyclophilin A)